MLILTTFGERDENVLRALGHGSAGFLLKDTAPQELIHAVRAAAAGNAYLFPAATRHVVDTLASPPPPCVARRRAAAWPG
ncbi:Response regulator transcription factor OS=Streptomyces tendae OX=1932 GN=GUR47_07290 PE=4 SV=1 [Streptomyces tendae]